MPEASSNAHVLQVVFSVCATPDVTAVAHHAVDCVMGSEFVGEFQQYITADRRPQFTPAVRNAPGVVALVDCDRDSVLALETMQRLHQTFPGRVSLLALSSNKNADFLLNAMRSGCNDFLDKPADAGDMAAILMRFQSSLIMQSQPTRELGRVLSFFGVKGGVGTSTLAVHLANYLVRKYRKKVLLIDHRHELGHVALYLGLKEHVYHFDELVRTVDKLDSDLIEGFVMRHTSGLDVLPSSDTCAALQEAPGDAIERVMDCLRRNYDFVLVDSAMQYTLSMPALMAASDEVSLVTTPDVASLRDLARHIEHLSLLPDFASKLRVIVNRSTSDNAVTAEQIESAVRFPVSLTVPNNYMDLYRAINSGEPISVQHRGAFTQAIARWASRLANDNAFVQSAPTKNRLAFWK
jgi:pilus assembly protein CpaE